LHEFAGIAFCLVYIILQNFRMWFKYGLKAQKLLAQGIALGTRQQLAMRPVRAMVYESFCPYRATNLRHDYPGHRPGLGASALSGRKGTGWVVTFIL
jgi:hypothetical protein